ncbi:MAG: acetolactate decarboxylase [Calditrichaeota bacterium]|nr:acetolactate decarboxylase [Calditrichota bacterium]
MNKVTVIMVAVLLSCTGQSTKVQFYGALKNFRSGDISAKIKLTDIPSLKSAYGLGAAAQLNGEIVTWDGETYHSYVDGDEVKTEKSPGQAAALYVFSSVSDWKTETITDIHSLAELEKKLVQESEDLEIDEPFPFLLQGNVAELEWHVINWDPNNTDHSPAAHKNSGLKGQLSNETVRIIGFYSTKHKAVFTHHDSSLHLHVLSTDGRLAAHVDQLAFTQMQLSLVK